jgi:hypothetical protein
MDAVTALAFRDRIHEMVFPAPGQNRCLDGVWDPHF